MWRVILFWLLGASFALADLPRHARLLPGSYDPLYPVRWTAQLQLTPGTHQLVVKALNWSGFYTASATSTFTNKMGYETAAITRDYDGNIIQRTWSDTNGTMLHQQQLYFDVKNHLTDIIDGDGAYNGFVWHAEYDGLDRRFVTEYYVMTNANISITPQTIYQHYDPNVEFLELGVSVDNQTTWKLYGPDLNGKYGGLNGTGGLDAVSPYLDTFNPVISDFRGNILAEVTNGVAVWTAARPTGYGAVPGYQPMALGHGADVAQASAWRGRWMDITSYYNIGKRPYGPLDGMWLSYDPMWNAKDPNYLTFCGGDPINTRYFDADGRCAAATATPQAGDYYMSTPFGNIAFDESGGTEIWIGDMFCYLPAHSGFNPLEGVGDMAEQYALDTILNYSAIQQDASLAFNQNYSSGWGMAIGVTAGVKLGADVLMVAGNALSFGELGVGKTAVQKGLTELTETGVKGLTEGAAATIVSRNPNAYEVLFEAPISGTSRTAQRASANNFLANQLQNDAQLNSMFNQQLGGNVLQDMESGSGTSLLNPPGTVWHHPFDDPTVMQLLQTGEHTAPSLQSVLHPGGVGGFGNFYGP